MCDVATLSSIFGLSLPPQTRFSFKNVAILVGRISLLSTSCGKYIQRIISKQED